MTTITLPATAPTRTTRLPRTSSLRGWTEADGAAWLAAHPQRRDRLEERATGARPQWGAAEIHGITATGQTLRPIQEDGWRAGCDPLPGVTRITRADGSVDEQHVGRERGHRLVRGRRRYSRTGSQGTGEALGLTPWRQDDYPSGLGAGMRTTRIVQTAGTIREEYSASVPSSYSMDESSSTAAVHAEVVDGRIIRHTSYDWYMGDWQYIRPRAQLCVTDRDPDGCRPCRDGHVGRLSIEPGRLLIRDGGLPISETARLMEITPMITRPVMLTSFISSLGAGYRVPLSHRSDRRWHFEIQEEVDYTDHQACSHDAGLRDETVRTQLRIFGALRPTTTGRVRSTEMCAARLDSSRVRSRERALDTALRLAFVETHTASDTLSLDVSGTDEDGAESAWIPTTDSVLERWLTADTYQRAELEAIDWVQRRLTASQWTGLIAEDLSSDAIRRQRSRAMAIIEAELPGSLRIRR